MEGGTIFNPLWFFIGVAVAIVILLVWLYFWGWRYWGRRYMWKSTPGKTLQEHIHKAWVKVKKVHDKLTDQALKKTLGETLVDFDGIGKVYYSLRTCPECGERCGCPECHVKIRENPEF